MIQRRDHKQTLKTRELESIKPRAGVPEPGPRGGTQDPVGEAPAWVQIPPPAPILDQANSYNGVIEQSFGNAVSPPERHVGVTPKYNIEDLARYIPGFREYCRRRYSRWHARDLARYIRLGLEALRDPTVLLGVSWRKGEYAIEALRAFSEYLKALGIAFEVDTKFLRRFVRKRTRVSLDIFAFESDGRDIIEKAVETVLNPRSRQGRGYLLTVVTLVAFFTVLRSTEIRYLARNYRRLRKIRHASVVIVETGYDRGTKKSWITMFPEELEPYVEDVAGTVLGERLADHLRDCGVSIQLLRKAHVAILLNGGLDSAEVDLLQGRLSRIIVAHYIRHVRKIAEKYRKAFEPYLSLIGKVFRK